MRAAAISESLTSKSQGASMKTILPGIFVAMAFSASAMAADLAPTYKAPMMVPPAPTWAGFYIGINGGGGIAQGDILDPECYSCASTTIHAGFGTIGGQLGVNWQFSNLVLGLEGDLNWVSANKSVGYALDDSNLAGTATFKMDAFASFRGRAGLAVDRTLIYVTGGPAWGHFNSSAVLGDQSIPPVVAGTAFDHEWRFGVAAGAGVEFMVTSNWILRGEFLVLDFLDAQQPFTFNPAVTQNGCRVSNRGPTVLVPCQESFGNSAEIVRVGASYKLPY
jgi:outer membrane immunogenic protein